VLAGSRSYQGNPRVWVTRWIKRKPQPFDPSGNPHHIGAHTMPISLRGILLAIPLSLMLWALLIVVFLF